MSQPSTPVFSTVQRGGSLTVSSGSPWEPKIGYSRAVKKGNMIFVSGCVGIEADKTYSTNVTRQTERSLEIIRGALESLGASIADVVSTRMYITDIAEWENIALAHGKVFSEIRPATVMVEVSRLIDDAARVEIEATAIVG
ncbi:MAG: RidA family protein [Phycisphaerae bacterium]